MLVLGIHGGQTREIDDAGQGFAMHDGAAVLVEDGEVVAAIEEERLNRVKHSNFFPVEALRFCLREARVDLEQVDWIAMNCSERSMDMHAATCALGLPHERIVPMRFMVGSLFARTFGVDVTSKLRFVHHHIAHAASAYYASGFDKALVVTMDGDGDGLCGMSLVADGGELQPIKEYPDSKSLGNWYSNLIRILGYKRFDEYKVMGLAPHGDPRVFADLFQRFYRLLPEGDYALLTAAEHLALLHGAGLLARSRLRGEPFTQEHKDFAAALQAALEDIGMHIVRSHQKTTKLEKLCLAGGVIHNCSMNGKLLYSGLFDAIFAQPAAHDAGTALGAAWQVCREQGQQLSARPLRQVFWGTKVADSEPASCKTWARGKPEKPEFAGPSATKRSGAGCHRKWDLATDALR